MRLISSLKRSDYSTLALFTNLVFLLSIIDNSYQLFPSNHDSIKGNYVRSNTIPVDDPPRNNNESFTYRINNSNSSALIANNDSDREARRSVVSAGVFSLISFENVPCNGSSGDVGICYSARECSNLGGNAAGGCAGNYGVCCVLTVSCGGTVSINNSYIVNPGYPGTTTGPLSCTITINKLPGASQVYLEYTKFQLAGPTLGACTNDSMTLTVAGNSAVSTYPILCGNNTGQMDYIDLSSATGPVKITFTLANSADARCWKIRVVQFKPTDLCAAPPGCTQYLRDLSGVLESYNFDGGQGQLLNDYCIKICFQPHAGYCDVLLTEGTFMLSGIARSDCMGDYILANGQQFCGETLDNGMLQVNATVGAVQLTVCSDDSNPDMDVGYNLNYKLLPCSSTG